MEDWSLRTMWRSDPLSRLLWPEGIFLFCDTAKGADASAQCFSMIETAKRNKLDPFGYLLFLLQELPKPGSEPTREQLLPLLPWSTALPEYCHLS